MDATGVLGSVICLTLRLPTSHHTIYCALLLTLLHFLAFIAAMCMNYYYGGTIAHLIEVSKALGYQPDVSKLPVGTIITTERSTSYKWKGNVQPGGIVIGSGMESMTDSVTLKAPTKEAVKRDSKFIRHVMVDAVRAKLKRGGKVVAARKKVSAERRALEKKNGKAHVSKHRSPEGQPPKKLVGIETSGQDESELETITFNSLLEVRSFSSHLLFEIISCFFIEKD
ncbi:unnamed protein product [Strongylus vulgaris]|uniref:Uncharacterized protein n=1 Tax=Strongylus vulgaris TaxID=40348 RepID=A0A3P7IEG4_STRVU|nr:unnamed protein product [Strongylus vulgaris]